jgi:hypothetical protein
MQTTLTSTDGHELTIDKGSAMDSPCVTVDVRTIREVTEGLKVRAVLSLRPATLGTEQSTFRTEVDGVVVYAPGLHLPSEGVYVVVGSIAPWQDGVVVRARVVQPVTSAEQAQYLRTLVEWERQRRYEA